MTFNTLQTQIYIKKNNEVKKQCFFTFNLFLFFLANRNKKIGFQQSVIFKLITT